MGLPLAEAVQSGGAPSVVHDLAAVMLVAGLVTLLFHYAGWPKVIGYILAGVLMGAFQPLRHFMIHDEASVNALANLGVIFLMFTLGMELNVRELKTLGGTVFPTAVWDLCLMVVLGFIAGRMVFGWEVIPCLVLGAMLCDSSTTLLAKSLEEMGCAKERFASVIFGTTICEDVLTIGVMAVVNGLLMTGKVQKGDLAAQMGQLVLFLTGVLIFGLVLLPRFLNRLMRETDNELLLLVILGICFGISFVAEKMSFSLALGAFLVGAVVAASKVRRRVYDHAFALRGMFSAVFFVTIGLMVEPAQLLANGWQILALSLLVIVGKTLNCLAGAVATGQSFREALQIGVGLAQLGDFAYLVALMAISRTGGMQPYPQLYQIAVGVSILTTLVNPFLLRHSVGLGKWLEEKAMPQWLNRMLQEYAQWVRRTGRQIGRLEDKRELLARFGFFMLDLVLIAVIFSIGTYVVGQNLLNRYTWAARISDWISYLVWLALCIMTLPLAVSAILRAHGMGRMIADASVPAELSRRRWAVLLKAMTKAVVRGVCGIIVVVEFIGLSLALMASGNELKAWRQANDGGELLRALVHAAPIPVTLVAVVIVGCILFWKRMKRAALEGQQNFLSAMKSLERGADEEMDETGQGEAAVYVPEGAAVCGQTIARLQLRRRTGASVVRILRKDGITLSNPGPSDTLEAGDRLFLSGTAEQQNALRELLGQNDLPPVTETLTTLLTLQTRKIILHAASMACNQRLADSRIRNRTGATVVRIDRKGSALHGVPGPDTVLLSGDEILVMGTQEQLDAADILLGNRMSPHGEIRSE